MTGPDRTAGRPVDSLIDSGLINEAAETLVREASHDLKALRCGVDGISATEFLWRFLAGYLSCGDLLANGQTLGPPATSFSSLRADLDRLWNEFINDGAVRDLVASMQDTEGSEGVAARLLLRRFLDAGVECLDEDRRRLLELRARERSLLAEFRRNLSSPPVISIHRDSLMGLPAQWIDKWEGDGEFRNVVCHPADVATVLAMADLPETRRRFFREHRSRAYPRNAELIVDLLRTRESMARILGANDWAELQFRWTNVQMDDVFEYLQRQGSSERLHAIEEFRSLNAGEVTSADTDWLFRSSKKASPERENSVGIERVLTVVGDAAGVKFRQNSVCWSWNSNVSSFDVFRQDGEFLGLLYLDQSGRRAPSTKFLIRGLREAGWTRRVVSTIPSLAEQHGGDALTSVCHEIGHALDLLTGTDDQWPLLCRPETQRERMEMVSILFELLPSMAWSRAALGLPEEQGGRRLQFAWQRAGQVCTALVGLELHRGPSPADVDDLKRRVSVLRSRLDPALPVQGAYPWSSSLHIMLYGPMLFCYYLASEFAARLVPPGQPGSERMLWATALSHALYSGSPLHIPTGPVSSSLEDPS